MILRIANFDRSQRAGPMGGILNRGKLLIL